MEKQQLSIILEELKSVRERLNFTESKLLKVEAALDVINKSIKIIENIQSDFNEQADRILKLEFGQDRFTEILENTNKTLDKLNTTVSILRDELLSRQASRENTKTTAHWIFEIIKLIGMGGCVAAGSALIKYLS